MEAVQIESDRKDHLLPEAAKSIQEYCPLCPKRLTTAVKYTVRHIYASFHLQYLYEEIFVQLNRKMNNSSYLLYLLYSFSSGCVFSVQHGYLVVFHSSC